MLRIYTVPGATELPRKSDLNAENQIYHHSRALRLHKSGVSFEEMAYRQCEGMR